MAAVRADDCDSGADQGIFRVLVVDTDEASRTALQLLCSELGFACTTCASPGEALELLKRPREPVHLVIAEVRPVAQVILLSSQACSADLSVCCRRAVVLEERARESSIAAHAIDLHVDGGDQSAETL